MSSHIRQRKSPYFYVRKGSGFVLLDNHEETNTRYKTEAEAKKAVLALNDAWRAKHAPRANPGPMMYSIMRAQEEARKKAKRNPEGDVSLTLWARPKGQTDALYEQPIYTVGRTMEDVERVKKLAAKDGWHTFRVQRIDLSKPFDAQAAFAGGVRGSRRRNPAPTRAEIVERADISIENGMGSETMTALEDMLDGYDGDNIRAQFYVGWRDSDLQALLDELGTRNVRRRNPRKYDESKAKARVHYLLDRLEVNVGVGRALEAFDKKLGLGEALSALDLENAVTAAEARLEDAEYDLKTNRIAEHRSGLREERNEFRQLLNAIKAMKPSHTRNPRKYDESRDDAGFRKVSDLKKGEYFKRKPDARKVYRKGDYDRAERKYECGDTDDISRAIYLKGDALVYVGFDY